MSKLAETSYQIDYAGNMQSLEVIKFDYSKKKNFEHINSRTKTNSLKKRISKKIQLDADQAECIEEGGRCMCPYFIANTHSGEMGELIIHIRILLTFYNVFF